jgi:hypothetical protein
VRRKKKLTTFCFLSFIKTHSNHQFGSNYRAIVAANKRNLGSPDRPLLAFTGKSYDDDDEDDEDGSAAADGDEPDAGGGDGGGNDDTAAAAAAAAAATAAADSTIPSGRCGGGFGGVGAGSSSGRRGGGGGGGDGDGSSAIKWKTTLSATPAATLAKSRKATSLQAAEWPAPSCADAQIVYLAFDILSLDGKCVAGRPLSERKELLRRAVVGEDEFLKEADDDVDGRSQRSIRTLLLSDSHEIPRSCADPGRRGGLRIGRTPGNPMRGRLLAMLPDAAPLHSLGAQPPRCERAATRAEVELAAKEAEKNLEEVFRSVENDDGVLLFDEADALFGKRSDVSDARDRYANIEVAYLLQRIEQFDGLAILTTNLRANLDEAFQRRLDAIVDFEEPDADARFTIWARALGPFEGSVAENDLRMLAAVDITGGSIRSAVVTAAYYAAAKTQTIAREHLLRGLQEEWRKAGRLNFPAKDFVDWR